jgi:cold-inducible RNA-binding protein
MPLTPPRLVEMNVRVRFGFWPCSSIADERPLFLWSSEMGKKLYVGNLAFSVTDSTLQQMFGAHGTVQSAQVIMDRDSGRSKGFGFVEMGNDQEAQAAIQSLNMKEVDGRSLKVNEAKPKAEGGGGDRRY